MGQATCSRGLCRQCAIHVGRDEDYCLAHAPVEYAGRVVQIQALNARIARRR
jgi:hypothetical protein